MTFGNVPAVFLNRQNAYFFNYLRSWEPSFYVQDDWHAKSWLTLNFGLRYDIFTPFSDAHNRYANYDVNKLAMTVGGTGGVETYYKNIAPRFGFAAQLGSGFVLRGGFGMITYPGDYSGAITMFNPPYSTSVNCSPIAYSCGVNSSGNAIGTLAVGPPNSPAYQDPSIIYSPAAGGLTLVAKQKNWHSPYLEQYNLILQKEIGKNAITLGYVGSLGRHQDASQGSDYNMTQADATGTIPLTNGAAATYFASQLPGISEIEYFRTNLTSNYNAMQASFERRYAKGLTTNLNYTWSHGLNDWSGYESSGAPGWWRNNPKYDYGNSDLDVRHRLALTLTYDLPFGNTLKGAEGLLLKGWSVSSSGYWQSGLPVTVSDSNKPGGAFGDVVWNVRPNLVPGQKAVASSPSPKQWFNPAAFDRSGICGETLAQSVANAQAATAAGTPTQPGSCLWSDNATNVYQINAITLGNERQNAYEGPHLRQFDLSLYKSFMLTEATRLQFRAECYNISNTPNFAQPGFDINSIQYNPNGSIANLGNFGLIQSTAFGSVPRVWQFALKLTF